MSQEAGEGLKEPRLVVYTDKNQNSAVSFSSSDDIHDSVSSENDGGTTIVLERTRNGWYSGLCVL